MSMNDRALHNAKHKSLLLRNQRYKKLRTIERMYRAGKSTRLIWHQQIRLVR